MGESDLRRFIKDLETLRIQFRTIKRPRLSSYERTWGTNNLNYAWENISQSIVDLINWANKIIHDDPWWGAPSNDNVDLSDTGTDRGPQDLRDDWPHAIPVPGGAWLTSR